MVAEFDRVGARLRRVSHQHPQPAWEGAAGDYLAVRQRRDSGDPVLMAAESIAPALGSAWFQWLARPGTPQICVNRYPAPGTQSAGRYDTISPMSGLRKKLFYGDNLEILPGLADGSVDLVYLDPPFNSNRSYNVIFARHAGTDAAAQIQAFDDTWHWTPVTDQQYDRYVIAGELPARVADALTAFRTLLGENDAMAYLVNMAPRLVQLRRVLKATGSLYLHCDPTMSHYLKVLLDAIFGAEHFQNEISWQRSGAKNDSIRYGRCHDVILFYTVGKKFTWNPQYTSFEQESIDKNYTHMEAATGRRYRRGDLTAAKPGGDVDFMWHGVRPYKGRHWAYSLERLEQMHAAGRIEFRSTGMPVYKRYLDEQQGVPLQDIWTDIRLTSADKERLGYPTQKPRALLERIISSSSNEGDVILDPFCGCGTTIDAAQRLGRHWIGIDVTFIAVDLIEKRLRYAFGDAVTKTYEVDGIPRDLASAQSLFDRSPFDFERWAVSRINAQPNEKQVGDRGVDGVARFYLDKRTVGRVIVSVKGGKTVGPQFVRDLIGTVDTQKGQMGVLITMAEPSRGVIEAANLGGSYAWPVNRQSYPRIQVITIADLLDHKRPDMPPPILPYIQATRVGPPVPQQMTLDDGSAAAL
jgi:DNA modification methylase